ncbi:MAG: polysaccharide biosynthesis/export family protein [Longimicrobiaceae bacterium]
MHRSLFLVLLASLGALSPESGVAQSPSSGEVILRPGDVVKVTIWREEDLSGDFPVNQSGTVTLPLLGEVNAVDRDFSDLRDELLGEYAKQLRNPSITIVPLRRIHVLGEVNEPGLYTVDPTVSLAGAVAVAGGANPSGNLRNIQIIRDGQVIQEGLSSTATLAGIDVRSGDQVIVGRRSWFDRNSTFIVSALLSLTGIISSIIIATNR